MEENDDLRSFNLKNSYSTLDTNIFQDVVEPLLKKSIYYDRGVGFFTSGWLKQVTKGLLTFVKNKGRVRIITSIHLEKSDWEAIRGSTESELEGLMIEKSIINALNDLERKLEHNTLAALTWLVHDGIIEFRFAIPRNNLNGGIFHSKLSVFRDRYGNGVVLHGSQNDSAQASLNEESISVFTSWGSGSDWFNEHKNRFNMIWESYYPNLKVKKIEEAAKDIIIRYTERYKRPYSLQKINDENISIALKEPEYSQDLTLRDYQEKAIAEWEKNGRHGIFEMATGTGKTITSISAAVEVFKKDSRLALIVLVPYIHLVDQWLDDLLKFGFHPICCYESVNSWKLKAKEKILEYNAGLSNNLCLISTHQTSSMETFLSVIKRIHQPVLIIGDEIHELGGKSYRKALEPTTTWRIGLSATPDRWYDEEGTAVIRNYFGKTIIDYDLKKAIEEKALTPYKYYPEKIDLTGKEIEEYKSLSLKIAQEYSTKNPDCLKIENLLRKRADLIGRAENKIPHLISILKKHMKQTELQGEKFQHVLFYCNKGTHLEVLSAVAKTGLKVKQFVHDVPLRERQKILKAFGEGKIDGLVAIKCLDQGVDVPATRRAYILASSTNPREFVQRRGRILRKFKGKSYAVVHDFIVGPWDTIDFLGTDTSKKLLLRELPRFAEFSLDAKNSQEARNKIIDIVESLDLLPYLGKRPWEVYKELFNNNNT